MSVSALHALILKKSDLFLFIYLFICLFVSRLQDGEDFLNVTKHFVARNIAWCKIALAETVNLCTRFLRLRRRQLYNDITNSISI